MFTGNNALPCEAPGLVDELAFPSDDPIMTSELDRASLCLTTLRGRRGEEIPLEDATEEAVELTPEEEEVIEEVMAKEEPEVFSYDEDPKPEVFTEVRNTTHDFIF